MKYRAEHRQDGVALLLSLGILSLLLATGIAFITNTLLSQKTAAAYRFRTQANLLGRSAVNRVMMLMRYYLEQGDADGIGNLKSSINSEFFFKEDVPAAGRNDQLSTPATSLLTATIDNTERRASGLEQWQYLWNRYNSNGTRHENAEIIGRYAYWILPTGSVNFSEILRGNPALSPSNTKSTWTRRRGFGIRELNLDTTLTNPTDWQKTQLDDLDNRFASEASIKTTCQEQDSDRDKDYKTFQDMFNGRNSLSLGMRNVIRRFLPPGGTEEEVYLHIDTGAGQTYNKSSFNPNASGSHIKYHRFDLTRTDWNTFGGKKANSPEAVHLLLGLNDAGTEDYTAARPERQPGDTIEKDTERTADCIPALRRIGDTAGAYVDLSDPENPKPSLEKRRKQIAANLIDYCDADSIATSDSANWETTAPTYTGNEKTPYINEIMIGPSISLRRQETTLPGSDGNPPQYQYEYSYDIGLRIAAVEVFNMYQNEDGSVPTMPKMDVSIAGEFSFTVEIIDGEQTIADAKRIQEVKCAFSIPLSGSASAWTADGRYAYKILSLNGTPDANLVLTDAAGNSITLGSLNFSTPQSTQKLTAPLNAKVKIKKLSISKVHLKTSDGSVDYVRDLVFEQFGDGTTLLNTSFSSDESLTFYPHIGFEADDPRENLYQGSQTEVASMNWRPVEVPASMGTGSGDGPETVSGTGTAAGSEAARGTKFTFKTKNDFCNPANSAGAVNKDMESAALPEMISSAYIRNAPMQSLVELGGIHRAAKWQTLNLRASKRTLTDIPLSEINDAGDAYAEGDAGILDQVKLTPRVQVPHRLCINNPPGANTVESTLLYAGLFRGLVWNWPDHWNYEYAGTAIGETQAVAAGNILARRDTAATPDLKFFSRAELVNYSPASGQKLYNAYGQVAPTTDAQQETIPALVSGLVSFYPRPPDPVTLILAAQSIRDIGTPAGFSVSKQRPDNPGAAAETATVYSGKFEIGNNGVYFDEITGTVRFYAEIGTDAANRKVKLLRLEPLD